MTDRGSTRLIGRQVSFEKSGTKVQGTVLGVNPGFARADRSEALLVSYAVKSTKGQRFVKQWVATSLVTVL